MARSHWFSELYEGLNWAHKWTAFVCCPLGHCCWQALAYSFPVLGWKGFQVEEPPLEPERFQNSWVAKMNAGGPSSFECCRLPWEVLSRKPSRAVYPWRISH